MANTELDAVFDAWDKGKGGGRDEKKTRDLGDDYVAAHPEEFAQLQAQYDELVQQRGPDDGPDEAEEQCVKAIDVFRAAGFEDEVRKVQVWLWHRFEPKEIGGKLRAKVRIVNGHG